MIMLLQKPNTVKFDPANKAHRAAVRAFMVRRAWGDSHIRFTHDPAYGSVVEQVQVKLLNWFMAQEDKPKRKVVDVAVVPKTKFG
jgi:hypothetical protein